MPSPKRPTDFNQRALQVVLEAVGEEPKQEPDEKDPAAVARGRAGGEKGGKARSESVSSERRREIAKKAAETRWSAYKARISPKNRRDINLIPVASLHFFPKEVARRKRLCW